MGSGLKNAGFFKINKNLKAQNCSIVYISYAFIISFSTELSVRNKINLEKFHVGFRDFRDKNK